MRSDKYLEACLIGGIGFFLVVSISAIYALMG